MPLGFSHLVGAWLPAKVVEYYRKKEFSKWTWIALLFGAILPDADFLLEWLGLAVGIHRTFSHSLLFIPFTWLVIYGVSIFLLEYLPKKYVPKNEYPRTLAWAAALGVAFHIFFDCLLYPGVNLLWPFNWWFAAGTLYYSTQTVYELAGGTLTELNRTRAFIMDMGLGAAWFFYFMIKGKLKP